MNYFLNIGSNLGNRRLNLSRAVQRVMGRYGWVEMSSVVESAPWGYESEHAFLNIGIRLVSSEQPEELLKNLKEIERELNPVPHRAEDGSYMDRLVDIDIIAMDQETVDLPDLKIPHPQLARRTFFLTPMAELAPIWKHPATGLTCGEMLSMLQDDEGGE